MKEGGWWYNISFLNTRKTQQTQNFPIRDIKFITDQNMYNRLIKPLYTFGPGEQLNIYLI
jgi:hypothetical protein